MQYQDFITDQDLDTLKQVRPSIVDHDGAYTIIYRPDDNGNDSVDDSDWIYINERGNVVEFGRGDDQIKFDDSLQWHYDSINWVFELINQQGDN